MKKFLLTLLCLVAAVEASFAESYTIEFKDNANDGTQALTADNYKAQIISGIDYVSGFSCTRTYSGKTGLKVGSSSNGVLTLTLSDLGKVNANSIVVNAKRWKNSETPTIKVGNESTQSLTTEFADYTFNVSGVITEIKITTSKRSYVKSITVNYAPAGPVDADVKFEDLTVEVEDIITPKPTAPEGLTFTYSSDNEDVVYADESGMLAMGVGTATITASWGATDSYNAGSTTFTVTVTPKDTRADAGLIFGEETFAAVIGQDNPFPEFVYDTDGAITFTSSNPEVATIDENGAITLVGEGTTTISATSAATDAYKAGEASYTLTVTDPNKKGTENNPYTVAQALAAGTETGIYVKGYVVEIVSLNSSGQLRYYIADTKDGDKLNVYNGKYLNGDKFTTANQPEIGSFVVICGDLSVYNGSNQLNAGNTLISITRPADAELAFAEAEYTVALGSDFTAPELSKKTNGAITWTSSKESVATVDAEGKVTLLSVGTTTIKATAEEVFGQFKAGEASYTLTVFSDALGTPECEEAIEGAISTCEGATLTFTAANAEKLTVNGTELTDGVYTVAFPENQNSYVLTVTAVRGEETQNADFTINRIIPGTVAFSAENGSTVMAGSTITLSCENADRIMWSYTEDGIFAEYTEEGITVDETNSTIFAYGEYKGFRGEIASAAYTMKEVEIYTLVTDVNELKVGGRYLIATIFQNSINETVTVAMGGRYYNNKNQNYRLAQTPSAMDENTVTVSGEEGISTFRLVRSGNNWLINFDEGGYLTNSSKDLSETNNYSNATPFKITISSDGGATIEPTNYDGEIYFNYNVAAPKRFKTYDHYSEPEKNGMRIVRLYHLAETFEAPAEDAEVIYMHGVFADRAWDFAKPVALTRSNDGTYVASNIHIGSLLEDGNTDLDFVFSTTMAEGGVPYVAGRRSIPAETNWADLGEGTVYHAGGVTKASAENAASEIVPYTVAKAGLYNITADFNNAWPAITLSESISTGVDNISVADGEAEYYNLQGIRVSEPKAGVYIRRQGNSVSKVVLR